MTQRTIHHNNIATGFPHNTVSSFGYTTRLLSSLLAKYPLRTERNSRSIYRRVGNHPASPSINRCQRAQIHRSRCQRQGSSLTTSTPPRRQNPGFQACTSRFESHILRGWIHDISRSLSDPQNLRRSFLEHRFQRPFVTLAGSIHQKTTTTTLVKFLL